VGGKGKMSNRPVPRIVEHVRPFLAQAQMNRIKTMKGIKTMKEILLFVGLLVLWLFLTRWLLPRLGVPT